VKTARALWIKRNVALSHPPSTELKREEKVKNLLIVNEMNMVDVSELERGDVGVIEVFSDNDIESEAEQNTPQKIIVDVQVHVPACSSLAENKSEHHKKELHISNRQKNLLPNDKKVISEQEHLQDFESNTGIKIAKLKQERREKSGHQKNAKEIEKNKSDPYQQQSSSEEAIEKLNNIEKNSAEHKENLETLNRPKRPKPRNEVNIKSQEEHLHVIEDTDFAGIENKTDNKDGQKEDDDKQDQCNLKDDKYKEKKKNKSQLKNTTRKPPKKDLRLIIVMLLFASFFVLCSPSFIVKSFYALNPDAVPAGVLSFAGIMNLLNSFLNPFLYGLMNNEVRKDLGKLFTFWRR